MRQGVAMTRQVLLVEDEPLVRMDAVSLLETTGLEVLEFDRADDALRYCQDNVGKVEAVFTDINLRGAMDGIDLAHEVSQAAPAAKIVVTSSRYGDRPAGLPDAATFVRKPWTADDILRSLDL